MHDLYHQDARVSHALGNCAQVRQHLMNEEANESMDQLSNSLQATDFYTH